MAGKTSAPPPRANSRSGGRAEPRTAGRAPARGSGSKAGAPRSGGTRAPARTGARSGSGSTARSTTPQPYEPSPLVTAVKGIGRGLKRLWLVAARWLGGLVRAIGRGAAATRDIDAVHRRDGIAFGLIALAVVCALGTWLQAAGPVGGLADDAVRVWIGAIAVVFPSHSSSLLWS